MTAKQPIITWQILDDQEWEARECAQSQQNSPVAGRTRRPGRLLLGLAMALVLLVAGTGAYLHHAGRQGLTQVQAEIQHTVDREEGDRSDNPTAPSAVLADDARPERTQGLAALAESTHPAAVPLEIRDMELHGDLALVVVVVAKPDKPWLPLPYRETRTYREGPDGWQRVPPQASLWGPARTLETDHFRFLYRQRDAAAVVALAGEVEALYAGLRRDMGLGSPESDEVLTVEIVPEPDLFHNAVYRSSQRLVLPSPDLLIVAAERTAAEALRSIVAGQLAGRVLAEIRIRAPVPDRWKLLIDGMLLWHSGDGITPFDRYSCEMEKALQERLAAGPPLRLVELLLPPESLMYGLFPAYLTLAAQGLVEYVVDAYGREMLPALVDGLRHYDTWEALAPAVFGVPKDEFEAGWQGYLAARGNPQSAASGDSLGQVGTPAASSLGRIDP